MRRKFLTAFLLCVCVCILQPEESRGAPSNGTRIPPGGRAEAGYEYSVIYKRPLKYSYGNLASQNHFYVVSLGLFGWLSLDGKIGIGDMTLKASSHLPKLEFNTGFAGGYGFRIKAYEKKEWDLKAILGFQHISVHPEERSAGNDKYETFLDDWQVSGLVSKKFKFLTPYVGMKGSDCEMVYKINKHDKKRRFSEYHIGLITGLDFYFFEDKLRANVEGRFFDETALSTSITYLF